MFFFIGGVQPKTVILDKNPRTCPNCGHLTLYLKRKDHYLSLFFIPLFPVKKGNHLLICNNCGSVFDQQGRSLEWKPPRYTERNCPYCGRTISPDFSFCPYCGQNIK